MENVDTKPMSKYGLDLFIRSLGRTGGMCIPRYRRYIILLPFRTAEL